MRRRLVLVACLLSALVCILVPAVAGCGGGGGNGAEVNTIRWGWALDFTGRAASAVKEVYDGCRDYLHYAEENDLMPSGIEIVVDTYDTQGDSAKVPGGYVYLHDRGADFLSVFGYQVPLIIDQMRQDSIPNVCSSEILANLDTPEMISTTGPAEGHQELIMEYIMNNWDYSKGKPKVGMVLYSGIALYNSRRDAAADYAQRHADKIDWIGPQEAPIGTTTWAAQVDRLKGADFVIPVVSGTPAINFIKEMRGRGFTGTFIGDQDLLGWWGSLVAALDKADLDGSVAICWLPHWDDVDNEWVKTMDAYCQKYNTANEYAVYRNGTGYTSGWSMAQAAVEIVRLAAKNVGASNVDGKAIMDAFFDMNLQLEGMGNTWRVCEEVNFLVSTSKPYKWNAADGKFVSAGEWQTMETLPSCD